MNTRPSEACRAHAWWTFAALILLTLFSARAYAQPAPGFSIGISPNSIAQSYSGTLSITAALETFGGYGLPNQNPVYANGTLLGYGSSNPDGSGVQITYTPGQLAPGTYSITVVAGGDITSASTTLTLTQGNGNGSSNPSLGYFQPYDESFPNLFSGSPPVYAELVGYSAWFNDPTYAILGTNSFYTAYGDGTDYEFIDDINGPDLTNTPPGVYPLYLESADWLTTSSNFDGIAVYPGTPIVTGISPNTYPPYTGTQPSPTLTITGEYFNSYLQYIDQPVYPTVLWNGQALDPSLVSSTSTEGITVQVPDSVYQATAAGPVTITVVNPGSITGNTFTIYLANSPPPYLTGATANGLVATIYGGNLQNGAVVNWNGVAVPTTWVSVGQLNAQLDSGDVPIGGTVTVTVTNPDSSTTNAVVALFTTSPGASVTASVPPYALAGVQNQTLTVNGSNFVPGVSAYVNGAPRPTTFVSSTQIQVALNNSDVASAGNLFIGAMNPFPVPGGTTAPIIMIPITGAPPTINNISPSTVPAGSPNLLLTINGAGFVSGATITAGTEVLAANFISSTEITTTIPAFLMSAGSNLSISATNPQPTYGASNAVNLIVTNPEPTISMLSPNSAPAGSAATTVTVTGTNFNSSSYVTWNGSERAAFNISAGQLSFTAQASDLATQGTANVVVVNPAPSGGSSSSLTFTITAPLPIISSISPPAVVVNSGAFMLTVNGANFQSGANITVNGATRSTTYISSAQLTAQLLASDDNTVGNDTINVVNPGGGTATSGATLQVSAAAVIASLSPNSTLAGSAAFTLTVNGSNFISGDAVYWNGSARSTTFSSSTKLTATINAADVATAGSYPVTVVSALPLTVTSNAVNFTVTTPPPSISSVYPSPLVVGYAAQLQVSGGTFTTGTVININGSPRATSYVNPDEVTTILSSADVAEPGSLTVTVTNPSSQASAPVVVPIDAAPMISSISPAAVIAGSPNTVITYYGAGFNNNLVVHLNGGAAGGLYASSTTQGTNTIVAGFLKSPGTIALNLVELAYVGSSAQVISSNTVNLTIVSAIPTITSLSPSSASPGSAGFTLTVNGANFASNATATWNGASKAVTWISTTQITIPINVSDLVNPGIVPVVVSNPGGGASNTANFTIGAPPAISGISPSSVSMGISSVQLVVNGLNFAQGATISFNGVVHTTTFKSATQLQCTLSAADLTKVGSFPVQVTNPNGLKSNAVNFTVAPTLAPRDPSPLPPLFPLPSKPIFVAGTPPPASRRS